MATNTTIRLSFLTGNEGPGNTEIQWKVGEDMAGCNNPAGIARTACYGQVPVH